MSNADDRSGVIGSRLLLCLIGLAIAAVSIGVAVTPVAVTGPPAPHRGSSPVPADQQAASTANGRFAMDLYRQLAESDEAENLFISPFSLSIVLTMAAEGSVDDTLAQMLDVLHISEGSLAQIHRGQQGLQSAVVPVVSTEVTEKINALRAELKEANSRAEALRGAERFKEAHAARLAAVKLAEEINQLVSRTSAYQLELANALWLDQSYPVEPDFLSTVEPNYGMAVFPVDFKRRPETARLQINEWVAQQTKNRIPGLLAPRTITDQMRLVITNTVYFRGDWAEPFEASQTRLAPFRQSNDRESNVLMMHQWNGKTASYGAFTATGDRFPSPHEVRVDISDDDPSLYPDAEGHTMLALDYQGHEIQMIFLLPQSAGGLSNLERSLSYDTLQRWIDQLERRTVNLSIPKFQLDAKYHMRDTLQSLGMVRAFEIPQAVLQGAQFDRLTASKRSEDRLGISEVVHQTYVDVSEVGTEAAAATSLGGAVSDWGPDDTLKTRPWIPVFKANRPFVFLIRDKRTASILFLGRYARPAPGPAARPS